MIPASSIIVDGDQALWVVESDQITSFRIVDRPCDNQFTHDDTWDCPDCDGTGRHTFDIEYEDVDELGRAWKVRVHIIDVLPIDFDRWYETDWFRTLPPDAAPGMWLIRLEIHQ